MSTSNWRRWIAGFLWAGGAAALIYCGFFYFRASYAQEQAREVLRTQPAIPEWKPHPGDPVGQIDIASVGISAVIFEGTDDPTLARGVGHLIASTLPGKGGNVVLAAHRDTFFQPVQNVQVGDSIVLTTPSATARYRVATTQVVNPSDTYVLQSDSESMITLITCYPFSYIGNAPQRYVVRGLLVGETASAVALSP